MFDRVLTFAFVLVILLSVVVCTVQYFIPISANFDMKQDCRQTLLRMETKGGLEDSDRIALENKLTAKGFTVLSISGDTNVKQGQELTLRVEAQYKYKNMTALFSNTTVTRNMAYEKTAVARKVVN